MDEVRPLALAFAIPAENDIGDALTFLTRTGGEESARRFKDHLDSVLAALRVRIAAEIASDGKPFDGPYELASLRYSAPVYRERLETQARRARRSSSGLWYVYYILEDLGKVGTADTLTVLRIRHAASEPFSIEPDRHAA